MNVKLLLVSSLFIFQLGFSQTESFIKGTVSSDDFLLQNVDVINKTTKQYTKTDEKGAFFITVNINDSLLFYRKNFYLKRLKVSSKQIELKSIQVIMFKSAEELNEVIITKMPSIKLSKNKRYEQDIYDEMAVFSSVENLKLKTVYDGSIINGLQKFIPLRAKQTLPEIEFATLAKNTCNENFFTETLKLKPEETELFLQFCDNDPSSKKMNSQTNVLSMMDFLTIKNDEFQKLKAEIHN